MEEHGHVWREYDQIAEDMAKRGLTGEVGQPLPMYISTLAYNMINDDLEAFQQRVKDCAYMLAMQKITTKEGNR
jgi:hypothetical protein